MKISTKRQISIPKNVMEALDLEATGNFGPVHIVTDPIYHGACQFVFYKDPKDISEEFYTRIGKKKPSVA